MQACTAHRSGSVRVRQKAPDIVWRQDLIRIPAMLAYVVQGPCQRLRQLSHHGLRAGLRVQGVGDDARNNAALRQAGRQRGVVPLLTWRDRQTLHQLKACHEMTPQYLVYQGRTARSGGACKGWIQSVDMHKHSQDGCAVRC